MSDSRTTQEGPSGRGTVIVAGLAAALVLTVLVCAFAFAESAFRATAATPAPPPSPPPAPPAAPATAPEAQDANATDDEATDEADMTPEKPGVTRCVTKDFMVAPDDMVDGDRYFVGQNADVEGIIQGDFYAFSKGASVPGRVTGDFNALASNVNLTGTVDDDVRVLAGEVVIRGKIEGDLMALSGDVAVLKGAKIAGRTMAFAGRVTLDGEFHEAMNIGGGEVNFGGHALGDVKLESDALAFTDDARIDGNLTYTARQENASLQGERARRLVGGKVTFVPKKPEEKKEAGAAHYIWKFWTFIATFLIGCLLILLTRRLARTILVTARVETLKSFGFGILGHLLVPFVGLLLVCVCLALGLITIVATAGRFPALPMAFLPPGLIVLAIWAALFYLAKFVVSAALGDTILRRLGRDPSPYASLFVGMIPLWILLSVPILGPVLYVIVVPIFGIGAILVGLRAHFVKDAAPSVGPTAVSMAS